MPSEARHRLEATAPPVSRPARVLDRRWWVLVGAIAAVYVGSWFAMPADGFFINDNGCKFIQLRGAMLSPDGDVSVAWPGREIDPGHRFAPLRPPFGVVRGGRLHGPFPLPFLLASAPVQQLWPGRGLTLWPLLSALLLLPAVALIARDITPGGQGRRAAWMATVFVALGTPLWFYALVFWEHAPAVCLAAWALWALLRALTATTPLWAALAGALAGLSAYLRDDLYLLLPVFLVGLVVASRRRWPQATSLGAAWTVTLLPLWVFQLRALGHPLGVHLQTSSAFGGGLGDYLVDRVGVLNRLLLGAHRSDGISLGLVLAFAVLPAAWTWLGWGAPAARRGAALWLAAVGGGVYLVGRLASPDPLTSTMVTNGLFLVAPGLALAFARAQRTNPAAGEPEEADPDALARRARARVVWVVVGGYALAYAALTPREHVNGIHWGCRYLLLLYPLLGALASARVALWLGDRSVARRPWLAAAALFAIGVAIQLHGLWLLDARKEYTSRLARAIAASPATVVVATVADWHVPQDAAAVFHSKPFFLLDSEQELPWLSHLLAREGHDVALLVGEARTGGARPDRSRLVRDRRLGFKTLELREVSLSVASGDR